MKKLTTMALGALLVFNIGCSDITVPDDAGNGGGNQDTDPKAPTTGLIAHLPMNGSAQDVTGTLPAGRINGASATVDRFGQAGQAMRFDGIDDYIEVDAAASQRLMRFPLTWSAWIRHTGIRKPFEWVLGKYLHPNGDGIGFFYEGSAFGNFYSTGFFDNWCRYDGRMIDDGRWHHVVFSLSASGMNTYVDGLQQGFVRWVGAPTVSTSSEPLRFGIIRSVHPTQPPAPFTGEIDDFRVYDHALSLAEIDQLYRAR